MAWTSLIALGLLLWGACGTVMSIGRRLFSLDTTLRVHLVAAPAMAFLVSAIHTRIDPAFGAVSRAAVLTCLVVTLDLLVVAPFFERSFAMFRSLIGTWIPFALIFAASFAAGVLVAR